MSKVYKPSKINPMNYPLSHRWTEVWSDETGILFSCPYGNRAWWSKKGIDSILEEVLPLRRFEKYVYLWVFDHSPNIVHSSSFFDSEEIARGCSVRPTYSTTVIAIIPIIWEESV